MIEITVRLLPKREGLHDATLLYSNADGQARSIFNSDGEGQQVASLICAKSKYKNSSISGSNFKVLLFDYANKEFVKEVNSSAKEIAIDSISSANKDELYEFLLDLVEVIKSSEVNGSMRVEHPSGWSRLGSKVAVQNFMKLL